MAHPTAVESCQIGVIFTTIFDQLARFSIEQHLLWVINDGMKPGALQYILQALLAARFVLGGVFVGLSKPEFNTVCVPLSSVLIVAIITVIVDAVIIVGLAGQAISAGLFGKMQDGGQASNRGKAVVVVLAGLVVWTGTSVPMSLGVLGSDYLTRSTIPGGGLAVLIILVIAFSDSLVAPELKRDQERRLPEAPSPRMITTARSISTSNSNDYPPSRFEDLKTEQISSLTAFVQPREPPHPGQPVVLNQRYSQNLPTISNASAGQGVGGVPVQGTLFPPMRANTEPQKPTEPRPRQVQQEPPRRAFFDSGKGPAKSIALGGKLAISSPVLQEGGSNPLDKVATTDLATAAQMDKERRAMMALFNDPNAPAELSANPLSISPGNGLMQTTSTIRKEVAAAVSEPLRPDSETLSTGSATGAQLSPSSDELRRRSPRQTSPKSSVEGQASPGTPPLPSRSPGRPVPKQVTAPGPNPIIRPSRQRPASPEPVVEPLKTPLQRRPTAGLPMNPRSRSVRRASPPEAGKSRQETVLFVNDIVYNDPNFVASVMEDARDRKSKTGLSSAIMPDIETPQVHSILVPQVKALPEPPNTASSIVHRPRPIPRKPSKEDSDAFYPPTGHRKSRSLGNLMQRKSILQSNPGSPTTLPPLPPPPRSARQERPHPNDTKSMTYSEKVNFLFPALGTDEASKRRSSVPDMQSSYSDDSATLADNEAREMRDRYSKRTMSSIRTRSIFDEQESGTQREVSLATYRALVNEEEEQEQQQPSPRGSSSQPNGAKRASSPVLPIFGDPRSASTADYDDGMTNIGSIYSPRHVQKVGLAVHQARAIEVTRLDRPSPDNRGVSAVTNGEEMTIMLDTSVARDIQQTQDALNSPVDDGSPVEETTSTRSSGPWHRRVGETTLSFSGHSGKRGSKRGPPPTPLALSDRPTQAKQVAIAKAVEPSPLPSPEEALQLIQAQLKKYEQADRASVESPGRQALLNDLEAEMGQQESRWLVMQNRFTQDSMTTLDMSPTAESRRTSAAMADASSEQTLSRNSSTRSNMAAERSAYRRTRQASIAASFVSITNDGDDMPFGSRASLWQKRLAAAHQEFMHTASELDRTRSRNFLALSSNLGSPTPPDSDESETEIESRRNLAAVLARRAKETETKEQATSNGLWTRVQPQEEQIGLMWVRPEKPYYVPIVEPPLPGLSVRPAQRKESSELRVESNELWRKATSDKPLNSSKLWVASVEVEEPEEMPTAEPAPAPAPAPEVRNYHNPGIRRSQTVSARPLTQRPPRRSKRITALPDIIEDPVPLPDKRDTLGIFQFPWGEKSDVASVPQRPAFTAMPGTMSTGGVRGTLDSRSREIEQTEYSSSFFDEYEEEDDSDSMGSESDDGFDETTLFEIASLLKANNVPSTDSFFGHNIRDSRDSGDSLLDQYMSEEQRNIDTRAMEQRTLAALEEEMEGLQMMPSPLPPQQPVSLWEDDSDDEEEHSGSHGMGLPQPDDWQRYDETSETIRSKPRLSQQPASVESDTLWVQQPIKPSTSRSPMWTPPESPTKASSSETASQKDSSSRNESPVSSPEVSVSSSPLWKAEEQPQRGQHGVGLPQPEDFTNYAGVQITARAKPRQAEPAIIESAELWAAPEPEDVSVAAKTWTPKPKSAPVTRPTSPERQITHQVKEVSRGLWSTPTSPKQMIDGGLFSVDSGRTDFRTTTQAPAAVDLDRKAQSPARKDLDSLTSTTLWLSPAIIQAPRNWLHVSASQSSPKRLLWSAPASPNEVATSGLFDPKTIRSDFRTTSQAPAAIESSRKPRSPEVKSLDRLTSTALWAAVPQVKNEKIWILPKAALSPNRLLWSAPASPKEAADFGLFTKSGRTVFRTTSQAPAAVVMNRKLRSPEVKSLDRLTSDTLWTPVASCETETNWLSKKISPQRLLWSAPVLPKDITVPGLFTKSARTDYKTTAMTPAAIEIDRKPRPVEEKALEQLSSTSLWVPDNKSKTERDWISSANASGSSTPNPLRVDSSPEAWRIALEEAVAASYPVALVKTSHSVARVSPVASEQWLQALDQAIAASYPVRQTTARKAPIQASSSDWAAALTEAIAKSYSITKAFDASRRHPVFAASSLVSNASMIHPAAIGYTADVAAVHPVFFGSGAGKPVHPAVPSTTNVESRSKSPKATVTFDVSKRHPVFAASSLVSNATIIHPAAIGYTADVAAVHPVFFGSGAGKPVHPAVPSKTKVESRSTATPALEDVQQPSAESGAAPKGRGRRITAMASMFEEASQNAPITRSFSISRKSSMSSLKRTITPPRPATPEPEPEVQVEEAQENVPSQQFEMDSALFAQIEALEQERLFAEQWAAGSFEPTEHVPEPADGPLEPSPMIVSATEGAASESMSKADQLAEEMFTPADSPAPVLLEAKTYEALSTPTRQQALSAEELAEQMFTPVDVTFMPRDITPPTQLAPSTAPGSSESKSPMTPLAQPTTPNSTGWFSAISSRLGGKSPLFPPQDEQPPVPQVSEVQRSNTVTSNVSALSESDTITLRDSFISVDSERGKKAAGSKIQIRY
ncbi:hypothetical protein N0V82_003088 [Gnomoniopsis sp. IMI 355080]|nr:hypothetical protein N0V82_003088 [Gnomoniopsis sp. IMI 355080]